MKEFSSPGEFGKYMLDLAVRVKLTEREMLEQAGHMIAEKARSLLGHQQRARSPFKAWRALSDSTIERRERYGASGDDPLLVTEALKENIEFSVANRTVRVGVPNRMVGSAGSPLDHPRDIGAVAMAQEMGTSNGHIPPRSFLGMALAILERRLVKILGQEVYFMLRGDPRRPYIWQREGE